MNDLSVFRKALFGKMRGVPARWGDPARGIPTLLDPVQAEEHHEPGPLTPFQPGPPPIQAGTPPPAPLWEAARGEGSRLERGSRLVAFSNCGRFGRGNTTSRVPPTGRDPLPLLIIVNPPANHQTVVGRGGRRHQKTN